MGGPGPQEASADMRMFAGQMRQMYLALTAEGFTTAEALTMIGEVIQAGMRGAQGQ